MNTTNAVEHFAHMCRACMYIEYDGQTHAGTIGAVGDCSESLAHHQEQLKSIFEYATPNEKLQIVELLANSTPQLLIQATDELPKLICISCLDKLLVLHEFQEMCIRSDRHMRNLIEFSLVEAKYTQVDEISEKIDSNKIPDADPLQATDELVAKNMVDGVSMEDVQSFLKLEMDEHDMASTSTHEVAQKAEDNSVETIQVKSEVQPVEEEQEDDDGNDDDNGSDVDWRRQHKKRPKKYKTRKTKLPRSSTNSAVKEKSDQPSQEPQESIENELTNEKQSDTCTSSNELRSHNFQCDQCPRKYIKDESLQRHKQMHTRGLVPDFTCEECGKKFIKRYALTRHQIIHEVAKDGSKKRDLPRPYVCEYCNKAFQQSCTLKDHIRVHTGEQPYLCSECGKAFSSASNMKQHLLRHTGVKRYECPDCPKRFPCLSDLASHRAVHKKIKPHICDICGAAFGKPFQLKKHKMYHTGEKPHKCEYCEMRFVCADHMRRHQRTHTGEKPYKCKYCERAFAQSNDMVKHLRSHLGDNVYKCEMCPKGYRLASELREHFAEHKNDDEPTRERNLKALMEEEARLRASLLGNGWTGGN